MPKQIEEIPLVTFNLNYNSGIPLYKQLYDSLQTAILEGKLKPGEKLPGTRSLAADLGISRNTVSTAFNQLLIEGYLRGKVGSGTYVNEIPENLLQVKLNPAHEKNIEKNDFKKINRSRYKKNGKRSHKNKEKKYFNTSEIIVKNTSYEEAVPFRFGIPAINDFPVKIWLNTVNHVWRTLPAAQLSYGDAAGYMPLRKAIADYLRTYRAVNCTADQIIIISGSQQGLDLIGRVLLNSGSKVWLEDPGYLGARVSMLFSDAQIYPSPINDEGIDLDYSMKMFPVPDLIYTTPAYQFPLGITMSIARRLHLLQYAEKNNSWIIEDDYDSEFRYSGNPLPSLQGMDKSGNVLYLGTFSKVLFPALRLGYLVLPDKEMIDTFASAKFMIDRQCPIYEQVVLTKFIEEGHFTRHIRKMRMLYEERQRYLITEVNKQLNGLVKTEFSPAGMHIILRLPENYNDKKIAQEALKNKILVKPLSDYTIEHRQNPGLILGYTAFDKKEIKQGISKLKKVII